MSAYKSRAAGTSIGRPLDERTYLATLLQTADDPRHDPSVYLLSSPSLADGFVQAFPEIVHNYTGLEVDSVASPFYQGVYFQKEAIIRNSDGLNIGFISDDVIYQFQLFSTFGFKTTVESISILDGSAGVTIDDLAVSDVFGAYEEKTVTLSVSKEGPASVSTYLALKFVGLPDTYYVALLGTRVSKFYVMEPNWLDEVAMRYSYLTSVFGSQDMSETRKVLRSRPQRSMEVTVPFTNQQEAGAMWSLLRDMTKQVAAHPVYPDKANMTASSTTTRIYCPTAYRRFQADAYAFLVKDDKLAGNVSFEVVRIDEVFSDGFSTVDQIAGSYVSGDSAFPALVCLASMDGIEQSVMSDRVASVELTLEEVYGESTLDVENKTYTPSFVSGLPVFDLDTSFESVTVEIATGGTVQSSGRGFIQSVKGVPFVIQSGLTLCRTKEEVWEALGFFNYLRGRGRPFWVFSELDWMNVVETFSNLWFVVDNRNTVQDFDYLKYIRVEDTNGDFDILTPTTIEEVGNGIKITLPANTLADIYKTRQAHPVRLSEDEVGQRYLTDSVCVFEFKAMELQGI